MKQRDETKIQEKWVQKRVRSALKAVGEAACLSKTQVVIPLKVINNDEEEVLLADLVTGELKKMGFGVYWQEYGVDPKIREYCVVWGNDPKTPNGFNPV